MQAENRPSCAARLLDVRTYVLAARRAMMNAEPAAALFMVFTFGLIALCLTPLFLTFDLGSTWAFTTGLRDAAAPAINDMAAQAAGVLQMSIGAALAGVILTSFTLLPSLFELAFPSVSHPLLSLMLWGSIIFDYVTDWGKTWDLVGTWTTNPAIHFVGTVFLCAFFSVGVQAVLVCCATVVIFGLVALVGGGRRRAEAVILQQQ
ncbi:hypothetical protein K2Z83_26340 [Oscillochloris sp. ZM17-4]|uniref:hypothetical protein n=1 Tax=Oscillochloris sp. ZM17-4 TaxID=2866714 RepID=UPI001C735731|nr:hypothetical protein [Oscillochloris sp. ZM17-4]MBX0331173.1 hypothetical protein [Oscillochloris sp. ZM17-4]